jgi:hypothetical protein
MRSYRISRPGISPLVCRADDIHSAALHYARSFLRHHSPVIECTKSSSTCNESFAYSVYFAFRPDDLASGFYFLVSLVPS